MEKTDKKTLDLINEVKKRKQEISNIERISWKTNCSFSYNNGDLLKSINLHVLKDIRELISIAAFLIEKEESYKKALKILNVENPPDFFWNCYSVSDWLEDIQSRINKSQIAIKKEKLENLEKRLNSIISPELRAEIELELIEKELN